MGNLLPHFKQPQMAALKTVLQTRSLLPPGPIHSDHPHPGYKPWRLLSRVLSVQTWLGLSQEHGGGTGLISNRMWRRILLQLPQEALLFCACSFSPGHIAHWSRRLPLFLFIWRPPWPLPGGAASCYPPGPVWLMLCTWKDCSQGITTTTTATCLTVPQSRCFHCRLRPRLLCTAPVSSVRWTSWTFQILVGSESSRKLLWVP